MERIPILCACGLLSACGPSAVLAQACTPYWAQVPAALPGSQIYKLVAFDNGGGTALYGVVYVGPSLYIFRWDGRRWEQVQSGLPPFDTVTLQVLDDGTGPRLHALVRRPPPPSSLAGWKSYFLSPEDVWEPGPPGLVTSGAQPSEIASFPDYSFDDGNGMAIYGNVTIVPFEIFAPARWSGTQWEILGGQPDYGGVQYIGYDDGTGPALYAAGRFVEIGGVAANRIARWDGNTWHPLGDGPVGSRNCRTMAVIEDGPAAGLYYLGVESGNGPNYIQKWDGQNWTVLPPPSAPPFTIFYAVSLAAFDDGHGPAIYLGGTFPTIGGFQAYGMARWDGFAWSPVGMTGGGVGGFGIFEDDPRGPSLYVAAAHNWSPMVVGGGDVPSRLAQWVGCPNCYANCDASSVPPMLNVDDFTCFINKFAARDPYANCDGSTIEPIFSVDDFTCYINRFAQGCP